MVGKFMKRRLRRSFTIVELLVVVAVIAILASLISAAAYRAIETAVNTRIVVEIGALDLACRAFKEKFGDYPPDNPIAANTFLKKAFPYSGDLSKTTVYVSPATALFFWLGGMTDSYGKPIGFAADPRNPFNLNQAISRIGPFFDFDATRIRGGYGVAGVFAYCPPNGVDVARTDPYVYFRARPGGTYDQTVRYISNVTGRSVMASMDSFAPGYFVNPNSFQIRSPGRDGCMGMGVDYPYGTDYDTANSYDYDDQANYCDKLKFIDAMQ
jgi:prepilin-type N-terminal cleavage/methylation domain-containing protein